MFDGDLVRRICTCRTSCSILIMLSGAVGGQFRVGAGASAAVLLIDTHCHVHVPFDRSRRKSAGKQGCCDATADVHKATPVDIGTSSTEITTAEGDRRVYLSANDEQHLGQRGAEKKGSSICSSSSPRTAAVSHVTMSIGETDWPQAIAFARQQSTAKAMERYGGSARDQFPPPKAHRRHEQARTDVDRIVSLAGESDVRDVDPGNMPMFNTGDLGQQQETCTGGEPQPRREPPPSHEQLGLPSLPAGSPSAKELGGPKVVDAVATTAATATDAIGSGSCVPFFQFGVGVHPWSAHSRTDDWLRNLTALLEELPHALVGEIGLDKVARTPDTGRVEWEHQLEVFQLQMALAASLSRPVSVHCVKAHGKLIEFLRESGGGVKRGNKGRRHEEAEKLPSPQQTEREKSVRDNNREHLPPRIALHSFTGSVEVARDIIRLQKKGRREASSIEVYFGFSAAVNMRGDRGEKRLIDVLRVVPDSSVLIETDMHAPTTDAAGELLRVCGVIAKAKGISIDEAVTLANKNAARFLSATEGRAATGHDTVADVV